MGTTSWTFLLVGSFAALGAAMSLGTLAALLRYRRTGTFPGSEESANLSAGRLAGLWLRIGIGAVIAIA
ncbi:MAG: hypothetical protein WD011_06480, partial [Nitriliruptoraceae bacterium]